MKKPDYIPQDYDAVRCVESLSALCADRFAPHENALVCPRSLKGDFEALANRLYEKHKTNPQMAHERHMALFIGKKTGDMWDVENEDDSCVQTIRADIAEFLKSPDLRGVELRLIAPKGYADVGVHLFHADGDDYCRAAERRMCCYSGATTEYVRNEDAHRRDEFVAVEESPVFEVCSDAQIHSFGLGDVWRQRNSGTDNDIPFIHRAPNPEAGQGARLILVADYTS